MQVGGVGGSSTSSISMKACKGLGGASPLKKNIMAKGVAQRNITTRSTMTGGATMENYH